MYRLRKSCPNLFSSSVSIRIRTIAYTGLMLFESCCISGTLSSVVTKYVLVVRSQWMNRITFTQLIAYTENEFYCRCRLKDFLFQIWCFTMFDLYYISVNSPQQICVHVQLIRSRRNQKLNFCENRPHHWNYHCCLGQAMLPRHHHFCNRARCVTFPCRTTYQVWNFPGLRISSRYGTFVIMLQFVTWEDAVAFSTHWSNWVQLAVREQEKCKKFYPKANVEPYNNIRLKLTKSKIYVHLYIYNPSESTIERFLQIINPSQFESGVNI